MTCRMFVFDPKTGTNDYIYFISITAAYRYYVRHYATNGDRMYYWRCAHARLSDVKDEQAMEAMFRNVFTYASLSVKYRE